MDSAPILSSQNAIHANSVDRLQLIPKPCAQVRILPGAQIRDVKPLYSPGTDSALYVPSGTEVEQECRAAPVWDMAFSSSTDFARPLEITASEGWAAQKPISSLWCG